jgi:hypothetical protein
MLEQRQVFVAAAAHAEIGQTMFGLHALGQAELRLLALPVPRLVSYPPALSPLTRWELAQRQVITTPTHRRLAPAQLDGLILARLDGTRTCAELAPEVAAAVRAGAAGDVPEGMSVEEWVNDRISSNLRFMSSWGLAL